MVPLSFENGAVGPVRAGSAVFATSASASSPRVCADSGGTAPKRKERRVRASQSRTLLIDLSVLGYPFVLVHAKLICIVLIDIAH
jgi:hypothetical protein